MFVIPFVAWISFKVKRREVWDTGRYNEISQRLLESSSVNDWRQKLTLQLDADLISV